MNADVIASLVHQARAQRLVILAGAGVSMGAPSSLPGWRDLNSMILSAVAGRVRGYFDGRPEVEHLLEALVQRRDVHGTFAPDYQAQIMEEQCGVTYFRALQAVDVEQRNASHEAIAALAAAGHVAAVVTTNFDRLLEQALEALGIPARVYANEEEYDALAGAVSAGDSATIHVVKVHGSVHDAASMVDTLKQRRRGRGPALHRALAALLHRHYWLYLGFSASDLEYDPDYLGLRAAGDASPGFTFLHEPDRPPGSGALALQRAYGEKGRFVSGSLAGLFKTILPALGVVEPEPPSATTDGRAQVAQRVQAWASTLHPMEAVSMLAALLKAAGQEQAALWVLHKTWSSYRMPEDTRGDAYARYLFNYGRLALLQGETGYEETPENFFRSRDHVAEADLWAALYFLYVGRVDHTTHALDKAFEAGFDERPAAFVIDRALIYARFADLYGHSNLALRTLPYAYRRSEADGDEPRRGRVLAMTALHLARTGDVPMATECVDMGRTIVRRLGDDVLGTELDVARAVGHYVANELDAAWSLLARAYAVLEAQRRVPLLAAATLEWMKVAYEMERYDDAATLFGQALRLTRPLPVYDPHLYWLHGRMHTISGHLDEAREAIRAGREAAERLQNGWMMQRLSTAAAELERAAQRG
jgi:tetratricopeptide (TPR) repeat protein